MDMPSTTGDEIVSDDFLKFTAKQGANVIFEDYNDTFNKDSISTRIEEHEARSIMRAAIEYPRMFNSVGKVPINASNERLKIEMHYVWGIAWPNALIEKVGATRCATVFDSTILSCIEIARYIFSRSAIFPWIGDVFKETDVKLPPDFHIGLGSWYKPAPEYAKVFPAVIPNCAIRESISDIFVQDMVTYLWFHETIHGSEGHADWLAADWQIPLREGDTELKELDNHRLRYNRQMMEIIADQGALRLLLDPVYLDIRTKRLKETFGLSREQWAALILLASVMTSFLWCQMDALMDKKNLRFVEPTTYYPISSFRLWNQILFIKGLAGARQRRFDEIAPAVEMTTQALTYLACEEEQFEILDWLFQRPENLSQFVEYRMEISQKATLKTELEKYRFYYRDV